MALIYPVRRDLRSRIEESEPDFEELAADLSDQWLVEVAVSEDGDDGCFGPLAARHGLGPRRSRSTTGGPSWLVSVVPLYAVEPAERLVGLFDED